MENIKMKSVTGRQIFDAIKENGWSWVQKQYVDYDPTTYEVWGACAVGQAELNLGVNIEKSLQIAYIRGPKNWHPFQIYNNKITSFNDEQVSHKHPWDDDDGDHLGDCEITYHSCEITYHSYDEIVAYAHDVLEPVFDTVFKFQELDFTPKKAAS